MRTILDIDADSLAAPKEIARAEGATAEQVFSPLLRHSLTGLSHAAHAAHAARTTPTRHPHAAGFQPFPAKPGVLITNEQVNAIRDAEGI